MRSKLNFRLLLLLLHFAKATNVLYCDGVYQLQNRFPFPKANKENDLNQRPPGQTSPSPTACGMLDPRSDKICLEISRLAMKELLKRD